MINNKKSPTKYKILIVIIIITCGTVYLSYSHSRSKAELFVGDSLKYFHETHTRISVKSSSGKMIVWVFEFSNPDIFDADFEIYVSIFGELVKTNPLDLEERLRGYERRDVHPYGKERKD